jgi:hypothetical protein
MINANRAIIKPMAPGQGRWAYFLLASFVVGAALFKAGAPLLAITLGIVACGMWNYRRKP